jgi:hypothetical protein
MYLEAYVGPGANEMADIFTDTSRMYLLTLQFTLGMNVGVRMTG